MTKLFWRPTATRWQPGQLPYVVNLSLYPVLVVALSGNLPERSMLRVARSLRNAIEQSPGVLSAELRGKLKEHGIEMLAAPVSGNAKVVKAGKLSFVVSGPKAAFDEAAPYMKLMGQEASYVGEGDVARFVKICHNVFLGVVIQSLCEITVLAEKAGVPRHAFLDFLNKSVMGSMFTRYKTPALSNLDFHVTFTPELLRKDIDLGLNAGKTYGVPMPLTSLVRDMVQTLIGHGYDQDFSQLLLLQAKASGVELKPENVQISDGL